MNFALRSIRYFIIIFGIVLAVGAFFVLRGNAPLSVDGFIRLEEFYAWAAVAFLYISLLATPLIQVVPGLPVWFRVIYIKARRATGVSAFFFAALHASIVFFVFMGGWSGLAGLPLQYLTATGLGFVALVILWLLAATSMDVMVRMLGRKWKMLHRLVYVAAVLILIHAMILGSHLQTKGAVFWIFSGAALFLLALEALRIMRAIRKTFS